MNPALVHGYFTVTEHPGQPATRIQIEMLEARYSWAAAQAGGKDVLEVACGAGMGLAALAEVARSVEAGDVDADNLRAAQAVCAGQRNLALRTFHAESLPFPDQSFELVLLFEAIYYLPDVRRFLAEARRVLRPGGTLLVVTVNPQWAGFNPSPLRTRYWPAGDLRAVLREAGFAAEIHGAFAETTSRTASGLALLRRAAVALGWIPRTMRGKAWLKSIFYGRLEGVPLRTGAPGLAPALREVDATGLRRFRVLYATAQKI